LRLDVFDKLRVPADRLIGVQDQGFQIAMFGISEGRISISANCIGMCGYASTARWSTPSRE